MPLEPTPLLRKKSLRAFFLAMLAAQQAGVMQSKNVHKRVYCDIVTETIGQELTMFAEVLMEDYKPDIIFLY
jgi:hypothetical protein